MKTLEFDDIIEQNDQTEARREHLEKLRELVGNVYPNKFERSRISGEEDTITRLLAYGPIAEITTEIGEIVAKLAEGERPPAEKKDSLNERLKALGNVRIAGRMAVPPRVMGKAAFVHLSDGISRLQIYVRKQDAVAINNETGEPMEEEGRAWEVFGLLDHGDFIGVEGYLFITNTGELSVHVEKLQFLAKAMLPMPDKMHGIADPEIRQRQRYADLIASSLQIKSEPPASAGGQELTTREVFERRAKIISSMRHFLEDHGYIEVETPMLTPKATGAAAKPFKTHHNALDIDLYARIAPELYLKRLVVGGFEKVYELNRNFRNEGISYKHNPEFTMLEFYCAYMDVNGMMDFCEQLMQDAIRKATGGLVVEYEENIIDFGNFERLAMSDAIIRELQSKSDLIREEVDLNFLEYPENLLTVRKFAELYGDMRSAGIESQAKTNEIWIEAAEQVKINRSGKSIDHIRIFVEIFEELVEGMLIQPTFIVDFPKAISPLSKAVPKNRNIAERFELFVNGMEIANGFSELNDPREQYDRFADQMAERERGDEEAMVLDEDYIRALSYGMPPAAGIGIGIDRLVMLLTNKHSIRDVILFPHMRPERRNAESDAETGEIA